MQISTSLPLTADKSTFYVNLVFFIYLSLFTFPYRSFSSAKTHASVAVNAVNKYREVYKLINGSLEATNAANKTSNEILTLVRFMTKFSMN